MSVLKKYWKKFLTAGALILLPGILVYFYLHVPGKVILTSGPEAGMYFRITEGLSKAMENELDIEVTATHGSLDNLADIQNGKVDFALYQAGTNHALEEADQLADLSNVTFVANLYSEIAHIIVPSDSDIRAPSDFAGKRIAVGHPNSGHAAMSKILLEHFDLDIESIQPVELDIDQIPTAFRDDELDAAFITAGATTDVFDEIFTTDEFKLLPIPFAQSLSMKKPLLAVIEIPAGFYRAFPTPMPANDIETVAFKAQLLANRNLKPRLVYKVARQVLSERFLEESQLWELFKRSPDERLAFAQAQPEFPIHPGAEDFYDPELHPLINSDFVEFLEGSRSFLVSLFVAGFFGLRWWKQRQIRSEEHTLDKYVQSLLTIERHQIKCDIKPDANDLEKLQRYLDEITNLRQLALKEYSAHDLNEDPAVNSFIQMCHALSDKINAKISRQRFDLKMKELLSLLEKR